MSTVPPAEITTATEAWIVMCDGATVILSVTAHGIGRLRFEAHDIHHSTLVNLDALADAVAKAQAWKAKVTR